MDRGMLVLAFVSIYFKNACAIRSRSPSHAFYTFHDMLVFQVWRDDKLSKDEILGSTCLSIGDLSSQHNGALFKKAVFESALISTKGEIVVGHGNTTVLNFLAELVPDIQFKL